MSGDIINSGVLLRQSAEDRRQWVRYPRRVAVGCRAAESVDEPIWLAHIQNISLGGLRIICERPFESGTTVLISPTDRRLMPQLALVVHVSESQDGLWAMGCAFTSGLLSEDDLLAWIKSPEESPLPGAVA